MQLGCVQLIISLDYLLNVVSRQPSGSWRREGWAALIKSDAETREKAAKQRTRQYLKCLTSSQTQTEPTLKYFFWMLFINNYHKERQDAPEQFLVPIFEPNKDALFSASHRFHKDSGVSNAAECAAVHVRRGWKSVFCAKLIKTDGEMLFLKKGLPKLVKSKRLYISTPPLTSCFVAENGAEPTPL